MPQIKHVVCPTKEEVCKVFDYVKNAALKTYSTLEEQDMALEEAKAEVESWLTKYTHDVFDLGVHLAEMQADIKDTKAYSEY